MLCDLNRCYKLLFLVVCSRRGGEGLHAQLHEDDLGDGALPEALGGRDRQNLEEGGLREGRDALGITIEL